MKLEQTLERIQKWARNPISITLEKESVDVLFDYTNYSERNPIVIHIESLFHSSRLGGGAQHEFNKFIKKIDNSGSYVYKVDLSPFDSLRDLASVLDRAGYPELSSREGYTKVIDDKGHVEKIIKYTAEEIVKLMAACRDKMIEKNNEEKSQKAIALKEAEDMFAVFEANRK